MPKLRKVLGQIVPFAWLCQDPLEQLQFINLSRTQPTEQTLDASPVLVTARPRKLMPQALVVQRPLPKAFFCSAWSLLCPGCGHQGVSWVYTLPFVEGRLCHPLAGLPGCTRTRLGWAVWASPELDEGPFCVIVTEELRPPLSPGTCSPCMSPHPA